MLFLLNILWVKVSYIFEFKVKRKGNIFFFFSGGNIFYFFRIVVMRFVIRGMGVWWCWDVIG